MRGLDMISYLLPQRAATIQTLGHPAAGVLGWLDTTSNVSGVSVDANTALTFSAYWCGLRVLCETVGILPCMLYRRQGDNSRERADDDDRYWLTTEQPHPLMNACTFFESQTGHLISRGNNFSKIVEKQNGTVDRLEPRIPDSMRFEINGDTVDYYCDNPAEELRADEVLHVPGMGSDGIQGWSVIACARQSIGAAIAGDNYAAAQMGNGATPTGVLKFPTRLDKEAREKFRKEWNEQHQGSARAGNIAILHGGMDYSPISMTNEDAQFLQSRQFSVRDMARWLRIPPHMLADLADSSVRANIEQQAIEFIIYSLKHWLVKWEQTLNRKLLKPEERRRLYFEFNLDVLLQGDKQAQANAWMLGRQWGWWSVNDIRRQMNQPPIPSGDVYLQPSNMVPADSDAASGGKTPQPARFGRPREDTPEDDEAVPATITNELQRNWIASMNAILDEGKQLTHHMQYGVAEAFHHANAELAGNLQSLREVRDEIRADMVAPRKPHVQGWNGRDTFIDACRAMLHREARIFLQKETAEVVKASRMTATRGKNFVAWLDAWYLEHEKALARRVADVVRVYGTLVTPSENLPEDIAAGYCAAHRAQLLQAADGEAATFAQRVQDITANWDSDVDALELREVSHVA